jgi:hypothetical protein
MADTEDVIFETCKKIPWKIWKGKWCRIITVDNKNLTKYFTNQKSSKSRPQSMFYP